MYYRIISEPEYMACPFCGYERYPEGDRFGCPNCLGEGLESDEALTPGEHARRP